MNFDDCIICGSRHLHYSFTLVDHRVVRCDDCGLMMINPQPTNEVLDKIYGSDYFVLSADKSGIDHVEDLKKSTADRYLDMLLKADGKLSGKLLEIGCGGGEFLSRAANRGLQVTGVEYARHACITARTKLAKYECEIIQGEIGVLAGSGREFDYVVFNDVLEHVRRPQDFLMTVRELLKPGGQILCVVPSLDSWSAKLLKTDWMEFKLEHLYYFDIKTLRSLLFQSGFSEISSFRAKKTLSIEYINAHFERHPVPIWSHVVSFVRKALPKDLRSRPFPIVASGVGVVARRALHEGRRRLTIIMPIFNEIATVQGCIERVLEKKINNLDIDIILVESNSTDGSREIVQKYENNPRVIVFLESTPKGKGHAVRSGLKLATGDFILIQDADDEYDLEDYEPLIESLRDGREAFVLGARHGGGAWKMRKFADQPIRALILNFGHLVFATLLNITYGVWLKDPFTMYKVFRRDCIEGVEFVSNRFDFDYELVIKLIRKGFVPIEIPVNYKSRSFSQGKKIRMFADPITWIWALIKFRFVKV
jgi:SAM-dependent methyltransferase